MTPFASLPSPSKIASWPRLSPLRADSISPLSVAPRPVISPTPSLRKPPSKDLTPAYSSPLTSSRRKFSTPPSTARALAIGNPPDGPFAIKQIRDSGGWAEDVSDPEIVVAIKLLAETEGIFTETAGGVTAGVTQKLIAQGRIKPDETTVVCITGNGLKTTDAIAAEFPATEAIAPRLDAFEAYLDAQLGATRTGVRA